MWKARLSELEFDGAETAAVVEALESGWITAGPRTQAFETAFARRLGTADAVSVTNGTAALFLALKALGVEPGDEVLCPSLTFVATAAAVMQCGAKPVFVDIHSLQNPTLDPEDAERKITARTKVLLPVHYAGIPANMDRIDAVGARHGIPVVEDAAHAPGATLQGQACGAWGAAGCFSLFGNKNVTTAEGGVITTSNPVLARRLRALRSHGMTVNSWDREKGRPAHYDVLEVGYNLRFDDLRAALGLAQLAKLDRINARRAELAAHYTARFQEAEAPVVLPFASIPESKRPAYHIYPILLPTPAIRDSVAQHLQDEGIQTSLHYTPVHSFAAFRRHDPFVRLPRTDEFAARELTLPLYPSLGESKVDTIVAAVVHSVRAESPKVA